MLVGQYQRIGVIEYKRFETLFKDTCYSTRITVLLDNPTCVACGLTGVYWAKERSVKRYKDGTFRATNEPFHFNLYAINELGESVLMTKDHIKPKSWGGTDALSNLQTMCTWCNNEKGNRYEGIHDPTKLPHYSKDQPVLVRTEPIKLLPYSIDTNLNVTWVGSAYKWLPLARRYMYCYGRGLMRDCDVQESRRLAVAAIATGKRI